VLRASAFNKTKQTSGLLKEKVPSPYQVAGFFVSSS
jgi:hypothetical protein